MVADVRVFFPPTQTNFDQSSRRGQNEKGQNIFAPWIDYITIIIVSETVSERKHSAVSSQ